MKINKLLGSFVLGASMLVAGCYSNKSEHEKIREELEYASKTGNVELLLDTLLNESNDMEFSKHIAARLLVKNHSKDKRTIPAILPLKIYRIHVEDCNDPSLEILPDLVKLLNDNSNDSVKYYTLVVITKLGINAQSAQLPISKILSDDSNPDYLRFRAAVALGNIGSNLKEAIIALKYRLKDDDEYIQKVSYEALKQIAPNAIPSLIEAFKEEKGLDLFSAIQNLGEPALPHLMKSLNGEENYVNRANLVLLLGDIASNSKNESKQKEITKVLINYLRDKKKDVRYNAATGLWLIGPNASEAIPHLEEISKNDRYEWVRTRALDALESIRKCK